MSADARPITAARFAAALSDLPVSSLHAKAAELKNSIVHLETSNKELEDFARENDDRDCFEALMENKEVIRRMVERIELVKKEVTETRGLPWEPDEDTRTAPVGNGASVGNIAPVQNGTSPSIGTTQEQANGTTNADGEEGVFL